MVRVWQGWLQLGEAVGGYKGERLPLFAGFRMLGCLSYPDPACAAFCRWARPRQLSARLLSTHSGRPAKVSKRPIADIQLAAGFRSILFN